MYKKVKNTFTNQDLPIIKRISDETFIPFDEGNTDYLIYLKWKDGYELQNGSWVKTSNGNEPLPADE